MNIYYYNPNIELKDRRIPKSLYVIYNKHVSYTLLTNAYHKTQHLFILSLFVLRNMQMYWIAAYYGRWPIKV